MESDEKLRLEDVEDVIKVEREAISSEMQKEGESAVHEAISSGMQEEGQSTIHEAVTDTVHETVASTVRELDARPIEKFPLFMQDLPLEVDENVPLAAIQSLLYEGTPYEQALNFKNQGNECFQLGPSGYRDARLFYSRGIEINCGDASLEAILYLNRAAANLGLSHFDDAIRDARMALDLDCAATEVKAHRRIFHAAVALRRPIEARGSYARLLEVGVRIDEKTVNELKTLEELASKEEEQRRNHEEMLQGIRKVIGDCGVKVISGADDEILQHFGSPDPSHLPTVHRDNKTKRRLWPVIFLYPAVAQSDILQAVDESCSLRELLEMVFAERAEWDEKGKYVDSRRIRVFWHGEGRLVEVKQSRTISDMLGTLITRVERGILPFYVCPEGADSDALVRRFTLVDRF